MYKRLTFLALFFFGALTSWAASPAAPDSVYLFSYATARNSNHNGLHFAWSRDKETWSEIGNEYAFVKSDYGTWGGEKKLFSPYIVAGPGGTWQCLWGLNTTDKTFCHTISPDFITWGRQDYPTVTAGVNVLDPVLKYDAKNGIYTITYTDSNHEYYRLTTGNFKTYTPAVKVTASEYHNDRITINLPMGAATGQLHRVAWKLVDNLLKNTALRKYRSDLFAETTREDASRFKGLAPLTASVAVQPAKAYGISDLLMGVFFEDINYAADGGLYAELIQNRDFEYDPADKKGRDRAWTSTYAWSLKGQGATMKIDSTSPLHSNNPHYALLAISTPDASLVNSGYDGISLKKGESYDFSVFTKRISGKGSKLQVRLVSREGQTLAQAIIDAGSDSWKKATAVLSPVADAERAAIELSPLATGSLAVDMVSLFPQSTFKGHKNGLRADLARSIADIRPRFVRFPGGCVAHGDGLENIYRWKNTIGPLESRKPQRNLWGYHQSVGLGYFEYFQFCEDIGAQAVPVLAAGVPCQNSSTGGAGQQDGLPMDQMDEYIQDVIDLVEYANGSVNTPWGKKRAEAGHPKPFNLKYIGIGNEDLISDVFEERFTMIYNALRKAHPEITIIGTVGPFWEGTDYEQGWAIADKLGVPMVDEHYYQPPAWFIYNQDYYDRYDRSKSKVYLGEYAAHLPGRASALETALAEALYLTSVERNGDVVSMASYAPLLGKDGHTQWNPNLIYFDNNTVKPTVSYYVQQLFGVNSGDRYLPVSLKLNSTNDAVKNRVAISVVRDSKTNDMIIKLVNLLPVTVSTSFDQASLGTIGSRSVKTVLAGDPATKNVKPVTTALSAEEALKQELPAYSLTVLRIKAGS